MKTITTLKNRSERLKFISVFISFFMGFLGCAQCDVTLIATPVSICSGQSSQLSISNTTGNNSGLVIEWTPTNDITDLSSPNQAVSPSVTTTYTVEVHVPTGQNLIPNGDFELGNIGFTSDYIYSASGVINSGKYAVVNNPGYYNGGWAVSMTDHTSGSGKMMIVDGGSFTNVWATIVTVQPNMTYDFSAWAASMGYGSSDVNHAQLKFKVNGELIGNVYNCGAPGQWGNFTAIWNSGDATTALIEIVDLQINSAGNDFAIDDIFFQEICVVTSSVTVEVIENVAPQFTLVDTYCQNDIPQVLPLISDNQIPGLWSEVINTSEVGSQSIQFTSDPAFNSGCTLPFSQIIEIHALPNVTAGIDQIVCRGNSTVLYASGAQEYFWNNSIQNGVSFTPENTAIYSVIGTDVYGCSNSDHVQIIVEELPIVNFQGNVTKGCIPLEVTYSAESVNNANYFWWFGDGSQSTGVIVSNSYELADSYSVTLSVVSQNGCVSQLELTDYITTFENPIAGFNYVPSEESDHSIQLVNESVGATGYLWMFENGNVSTENNPIHYLNEYEADGEEVFLIAYSSEGCTDTIQSIISVNNDLLYYVPNSFTPDGDKFNNTFQPVFTSGYDPYDFNMLIFDRWGEILFESNDAKVGWDGTYGGKLVQDGVYTWKIEFSMEDTDERKQVVGSLSLIR